MKKLRCIAVDDEPPALEKVVMFIGRVSFLELVRKFSQGLDAIEFIQKNSVDLVFLDIQMDDISGLSVIESLTRKPIFILTTAFDTYAVKGFELSVCDYILKPYNFERFLQAATKALNQYIAFNDLMSKDTQQSIYMGESKDYIFVKTSHKLQRVKVDDILYLQGMRDYLMMYTTTKRIMILTSFSEIERLLPEDYFFRIHKSYLIAINKIDTIENRRVIIKNEYLPISNTYYEAFMLYLKKRKIIN